MSYYHHILAISKDFANQLKTCETVEEYFYIAKVYTSKKLSSYNEDEKYFPVFDLGYDLYEFGDEWFDGIEEFSEDLFTSDELKQAYEDYDAFIIGKDGMKFIIECYREKIKRMYNDILKEHSEDEWDNRTKEERALAHIEDYAHWWNNHLDIINFELDNPSLTHSWLYEHAIWELVRIYKTYDWTNNVMLFCGW